MRPSIEKSEMPKRNGLTEGVLDVVLHDVALSSILQLSPSLVLASHLKGTPLYLKVRNGRRCDGEERLQPRQEERLTHTANIGGRRAERVGKIGILQIELLHFLQQLHARRLIAKSLHEARLFE